MSTTLEDFNIYLLDNSRSRAYLQLLLAAGLVPAHIYVLYPADKDLPDISQPVIPAPTDSAFFIKNESVFQTLASHKLSYTLVRNVDLNSAEIIELSKTVPGKYTIYCGGPILEAPLLSTPSTFIHCHPGRTPDFKGSTCFYYSLLAEKKMGVSCFFMAVGLDEGETLVQKEFAPVRGVDIDNIFDPWMRAQALVAAVKHYVDNKTFTAVPQVGEGETYFVIHPVLKTLAIKVAYNFGEVKDDSFVWPEPQVSNYEYTAQDRIQNTHKYSFAPFGQQFFNFYKEDRKKWSEEINKAAQEKGISKTVEELADEKSEIKTPEQLRLIIKGILEGLPTEKSEAVLGPWVKKYEVWKKLYTVYDDNFRKASDDCQLMTSYLNASVAALLLFKKTKNFKYLNVGLKLNDCICSRVAEVIKSDHDTALAQHCLNLESSIIEELEQAVNASV